MRRRLHYFQDQNELILSQREELKWLREDLRTAHYVRDKLKDRLVKARAGVSTLSKLPAGDGAELRKALRRSRRQKTMINSLQRENVRLRKSAHRSPAREAVLETELAKVRASRAVLSKWLYERRSEK